MKTKIYKNKQVIGVYDHMRNVMSSSDPRLARIPEVGVAVYGGKTVGRLSVTGESVVTADDPEFFFAFVDAIERMGLDVDKRTEKEYVDRRSAQKSQGAR